VVLPALGPSLSYLKSRARVLSGCAILDYFPPFNISNTTSRKTFTKQLLDRLETLKITDLKEVTIVPVLALYTTRFTNLKAI
jgi:hypothetical protein